MIDDVAMVQVNLYSGEIEYVLAVYLPEKLPLGCDPENMRHLIEWWASRAIPVSRRKEDMEKEKLLVVQGIPVRLESPMLYIGDMPRLVVNLDTQQNYIVYEEGKIPYYREIVFSNDLLAGKRTNVFATAIEHYYTQACQVLRGKQIADKYLEGKK